ncbi:MAG: class II glutamine amidotransferase [Rhodospirillaceae bacterium]
MCELLGMSANTPTDLCFSFAGLMERGGHTGPHKDGFGVVFYDGKGVQPFMDSKPANESRLAALLRDYSIKSHVAISHVRQATHGRVCLENTHPFMRHLWGRTWCFAHNGKLYGIKGRPLTRFEPVGTTDSEHAFCWIMDQLAARWPDRPRSMAPVHRFLGQLCKDVATLGTFNVLISEGRFLYTHCSTLLSHITRRAPFGEARLIDADLSVDFKALTTPSDVVTVIATRPLTDDEVWQAVDPGTFLVFRDGEVIV